ncbi:MAG: UDP-glucose dehydrogenase family protein [Pseudomonadales bacterium]
MKVSVAGTGYVGLVSGVCLADLGHEVICVDIDHDKVNKINNGEAPIYEDGLEELLARNIGDRLKASNDLHQAVLDTDLTLVAVGTPFDGDLIDLRYIKNVAAEIGTALAEKNGYHMVVVKSTVVPGTTDEVVLPILETESGKVAGEAFSVGMNPEFLKEGEAIKDFMNPDRIVLGATDPRGIESLQELYSVFTGVDKLETSCRTAEMIKYTANSLLATLISFSNEIGNLCAATGGVDVKDVMAGVHLDKRLSPILQDGTRITPSITTYIEAGCGFGGSCFPKDVKALVAYGREQDAPMTLLESVVKINARQPYKMLEILADHFDDLAGIKVLVLGLAFKPGSDDMRESPAIPIVNSLLDQEAKVSAYDPVAESEAKKMFDACDIEYLSNLEAAISDADVVLLVTRWQEFNAVPKILASLERQPLVVDGRRMLERDQIENYAGIGM